MLAKPHWIKRYPLYKMLLYLRNNEIKRKNLENKGQERNMKEQEKDRSKGRDIRNRENQEE